MASKRERDRLEVVREKEAPLWWEQWREAAMGMGAGVETGVSTVAKVRKKRFVCLRRTYRKCAICGGPIARGKVHDRCKDLTRNPDMVGRDGRPRDKTRDRGADYHWMQLLLGKMDRACEDMRAEMGEKARVWTKGMGMEERDKLFPDMKGRE